ncbi:hypothetical protein NP233_g5462 [Leucocoprinus birnbaumii]|uniref:NADH dehydrogenase [ubiquinone] 1 alpha subcomplex subunit 1 n=1 Tax=Leucocoprinus birnbaumii TaxID=56174 RepID=A0AAD5YRW0_9AGAR|nr:hypothetical protein NP233_g5462 [Leucocoprinus birnbaumii]
MPVPWEALIPFGLLTAMFGAAGTLLNVSTRAQNQGKPPRYQIDRWDEMMMNRDERLTGHKRGQTVCLLFLLAELKLIEILLAIG